MNHAITINDLPKPLNTKRQGFPWTEGSKKITTGDYPKISIVTPSYNQGPYLEETIRSVLLQGYPNLEYIVMDGGSNDMSLEILRYYSDFLSYWRSEPDKGQTDAINKGFQHSSGEIMGWLNSDDILLPNALQRVGKHFQKYPDNFVVTGWRKVYDENSKFIQNRSHGLIDNELIRYVAVIFQETTFWRRAVYEQLGALDDTYHYALDYLYWQKMLQHNYKFHLLPYYLGGFRIHSSSKGLTMDDVRDRELRQIYQLFAIAETELQAQALYAEQHPQWRQQMRFFRDLDHQKISDNEFLVWLIAYLLNTPITAKILLDCHYFYSTRIRRREIIR